MKKTLTLFFIVEPPTYQYLACYLAASIRLHLPSEVQLVGYCPEHRRGEVDPAVVETLRRMRCRLETFSTTDRFDPAYPHGNKILACLEKRDTDFSGFMDSDILLIRDNQLENIIREGHVSASAAASMIWAPQEIWKDIYKAFGMEVPEERILLMRDRRKPVVPYFSAGFVLFPEQHRSQDGMSFPETWMESAQKIDAIEGLEKRRPYLDQMSLPIAIRRSGLAWNELPEEQHFILGGKLRNKPFPKDREIFAVHYREWEVLRENSLAKHGYQSLVSQIGAAKVRGVWRHPLPPGVPPVSEG